MASHLTSTERENYFGPEARATFFEYYHHLSRQRFSSNPQEMVKRSTAATTGPATARSGMTEDDEDYLESEYPTTAPVSARPIPFAPKKFQLRDPPLFGESKDSIKSKNASENSSVVSKQDETYSWLKIHEDRQTDEERKLLLNQLLVEKGSNKPLMREREDSITSLHNSLFKNQGAAGPVVDRPLSARTKFLKGCVDHGVLPHPSLILRKEITAMLNVASLGMGNEMAILLAEALDSLPLLVGLSIADNNLSDVGLVPIVNKLQFCQHLRLFDLSNNKVDSLTADALRKFLSSPACNLVVLRMENANVDDYEASLFMDALAVRQCVKELDLCHNLLGSHEFAVGKARRTGGEAIGAMLRSPSCALQILKLAWNMIRFESAKALVSAIPHNQTLTYLDLSYNHLGVEGGEILGDALHDNKTLRVLKLAHNNLTARPVLVLFAGVKSCTTLKELDISENPIGEEGARGLLSLNITHGDRIKITIKNCSVRISDPQCWFEPFSPKGEYELDLEDYYQRSIYFELLHIIARDKDLQISQLVYTPSPTATPDYGANTGSQEISLQMFVEHRREEDQGSPRNSSSHNNNKRYDEVDIAEFGLDSGISHRLKLPHPSDNNNHHTNNNNNNNNNNNPPTNPTTRTSLSLRDSYSNAMMNRSESYRKNQLATETLKNDVNTIREVFRETSNRIFEQYDTDHSGWLDREELAYILEQLGLHGSHHLVDKLFTMYDTDQSGKVEEEEFISFLLDVKKSLEKDNFFHTTHRYLYNPADPRNSQVSFVYQMNPVNDRYYLEYTGPRPVPYHPPRDGKVSLIIAGYTRQSLELENGGSNPSSSLLPEQQAKQMEAYLAASKTLSEGLTLFEFALEATKWTINEARTFYKMMIKELGSPIQVLVKLLPHIATPLDARMLIADVLNHDFQQMQTLKYLLGSLYRVYVGLYNGFYSLHLSEPNDRQTFLLLAEINDLSKKKRQESGRGDTSQYGDWQCFRNTSFDNAAILITDEWREALPEKGRLEFDFVLLDNDHFKLKHKEISNLRLFRLLLSLGLIDETKRRRMFQKLQTHEKDGREAARGLGNKKAEILPNAARLVAEYLELLYDGFVFKRVTRATAIELTKEESFLLDDAKRRKKLAASGGAIGGGGAAASTNLTARSDIANALLPSINESSTNTPVVTGRRTINKGNPNKPGSENLPATGGTAGAPPPLTRTKNVNFNTAANTTGPAGTTTTTTASNKEKQSYQGPVMAGGIGMTELISADIYGHHIKEMIHEYTSMRSNNAHNPTAFMSNIDPQMIAARVLDALETILIARYLTCAQIGVLLERFPHGQLLLNDYSTYRVELVISLFSRIIDLVNFEYIFKELESFEIAMLFFRLGYLNLWNSLKPEGKIYLNLSRLEERKVAKILAILNYVETGET